MLDLPADLEGPTYNSGICYFLIRIKLKPLTVLKIHLSYLHVQGKGGQSFKNSKDLK